MKKRSDLKKASADRSYRSLHEIRKGTQRVKTRPTPNWLVDPECFSEVPTEREMRAAKYQLHGHLAEAKRQAARQLKKS